MINTEYNNLLAKICDPIFFKILSENPHNQKWIKLNNDDYCSSISYITHIKGVEIVVKVHGDSKNRNKAIASLFVGNYRDDMPAYFSSRITFSTTKKNYLTDFLNRLEIKNIPDYVDKILIVREKNRKNKEELELKINILKKFIPKLDKIAHIPEKLCAYTNEYSIELSHINKTPELCLRANIDLIIQIFALIGKNIK